MMKAFGGADGSPHRAGFPRRDFAGKREARAAFRIGGNGGEGAEGYREISHILTCNV